MAIPLYTQMSLFLVAPVPLPSLPLGWLVGPLYAWLVLEATVQELLARVRQSSFWLCTSNCSIASEGGVALVAAAAA